MSWYVNYKYVYSAMCIFQSYVVIIIIFLIQTIRFNFSFYFILF